MVKQYGIKKGKEVFYAYLNKHGYDETKPREGQKSKSKEFSYEGELTPIVDKQFYGASMQIIDYVEVKDVTGTNCYFEAFLTAPIKDLQGETLSEDILPEWEKECQSPPHNLGWLFHESPYKSPENKDKPAFYKTLEAKITTLTDRLGNAHKGLWTKNIINRNHPRFNEIWPLMKEGFINAVSAEFWPIAEDLGKKIVEKAKYLASCLVMAPANDLATITSVYAKSFNGGKIDMSEKSIPIPEIPADDLEALIRARDLNAARLMGEPVQGVAQPKPNLPLNLPQTPTAPAQVPVQVAPPTPPVDATAQKIDQILQGITQQNDRLNSFEQRLNTVAPVPKDPEPEEIMRVIKYLSGKEEMFKPKPPPQTKDPATKTALSPNEVRGKSYSWEEVSELLDLKFEEGKKASKLVIKAVLDNAPQPTGTSSDLSPDNLIDPDSIEGMLTRRDRTLT